MRRICETKTDDDDDDENDDASRPVIEFAMIIQ